MMFRFNTVGTVTILGAMCVCSTGCSKASQKIPVYPTKGSVLFEGKPLGGAMLMFHPVEPLKGPDKKPVPIPGAHSKEDGTFILSTYKTGDGLPPGEYRITVTCEDRSGKMIGDSYPDLLPAVYQNPEQSGLLVSITQGQNELSPFELKR